MFIDIEESQIEQPLPMECIDCVEDKKEHRIRKRLRTMSFGLIRGEPWYLNDPRTDPNYKGPYTEHYHPDYRGERFSSILEEGQESVSDFNRESIPKESQKSVSDFSRESIENLSRKPVPNTRAESIPNF